MLLSVVPATVLLVLTVHTLRGKDQGRWDVVATSLVLGGGIGNLWDRCQIGYVRDFLYLGLGRIGTNIFTVADMGILFGVILLVFCISQAPKEPADS